MSMDKICSDVTIYAID